MGIASHNTLLIGREVVSLDHTLAMLRKNDRFIIRCEGDKKKSVSEVFSKERTK